MRKTKDIPPGYVKIEKDGKFVRAGLRIEKIMPNGERILECINSEEICPWVRKFRGTIRYSSVRKTPETENLAMGSERKVRFVPSDLGTSYSKAIYLLREECSKENSPHPLFTLNDGSSIYRPLSLAENFSAMLKYPSLFKVPHLSSCTAVAYKKKSSKFRIVSVSKDLITTNRNFKGKFIPINYDDVYGEEFDSDRHPCNIYQEPREAKQNPLWIAAVGGDKDLLSDYIDKYLDEWYKIAPRHSSWVGKLQPKVRIKFWIGKRHNRDELSDLFTDKINEDFIGNAWLSISHMVYFLRMTY